MIYAIEKFYKGKTMGVVPNTGYDTEDKAEKMKTHLQEVADNNGYNVTYKVTKI